MAEPLVDGSNNPYKAGPCAATRDEVLQNPDGWRRPCGAIGGLALFDHTLGRRNREEAAVYGQARVNGAGLCEKLLSCREVNTLGLELRNLFCARPVAPFSCLTLKPWLL